MKAGSTASIGKTLPFLLVSSLTCASPPRPMVPSPLPTAPARASEPPGIVASSTTPDAPFREEAPAPSGKIDWVPPRIESWSLPNGIRVLVVVRHDLPIVAVRVVSAAGAGDLSGVRPGAVALMGAMLEQGAGKRTALEVSDGYEALGAEHSAWCDWDACVVRAKVLTSRLGLALDLIADVVLRPTLAASEMERTRVRWLSSLQQEKNSPQAMEQNALAAALYGRSHPYGHNLRGAPADVTELKRSEIEKVWRGAFQPRYTTLILAGDVDLRQARSLLDERFRGWHGTAVERVPVAASRLTKEGPSVVLVDAPGAAQSQMFVASEGAPFGSRDRIALGVMNAILGGMFSSRINLDLREAHAYTYGARSRFAMRHGAGPFAAGGAIFTEHSGDAARAVLGHIRRIRDEPVTVDELADAKENAKLALPARFEGVEEIAGALQDIAVYGLPLDEYAARSSLIEAVTAADVQRVAKTWLRPDMMRVVVTGDRAKIENDLASLGPIELRDAYGDPVK